MDLDLATRVYDVNEAPEIYNNGRVDHHARRDTVTATNCDKKRTSMTLDQVLLYSHDTVNFSRGVGSRVASHPRAPTIAIYAMELSLVRRFLLAARPLAQHYRNPAFPESGVQDFEAMSSYPLYQDI
jgi:hypothetical protein